MNGFLKACLASVALIVAAPALAEDPTVGDIFRNDSSIEFRGWKLSVSGISGDNIGFRSFDKGTREILAITKPLVRTARGGYEVEEIVAVKEVVKQSGEKRMFDCPFLNLDPAIVFFNEKTKVARGYFVFPTSIEIRRWIVDDLNNCDPGGE